MMARRGGVAVLFGMAAIAAGVAGAACGNGGTGGSGTSGSGGSSASPPIILPPSSGQSSCQSGSACSDQAAVDAYSTCILSTCDTQYKQCFGADYATGTFGGSCKALMDCAEKCQSCDQSCIDACSAADLVGACKSCITGPIFDCALDAITSGTCTIPCGPTTGGGVCDTLQTCCNSLGADDQAGCLSSYSSAKLGGDVACGAVLSGYTAGGQCTGSGSSSSGSTGSSSGSSSSGG